MLGSLVSRARDDLSQIAQLLQAFHKFRSHGLPYGIEEDVRLFDGVSSSQLRLFEYCTAVVRSYTIFERCIYGLVDGWVSWCIRHHPNVVLGSTVCRQAYEMGIAEILRRQTELRFVGVDRFALAKSHLMFAGSELKQKDQPVSLALEPFVAGLPNLRIEQLTNLFVSVALGSPVSWLDGTERLIELRDEHEISYSSALREIVERRNEVAHGNPDPNDILGTNELISRIEILSEMLWSLYQYLVIVAAKVDLGDHYLFGRLGRVTHVWTKASAFELSTSGHAVAVGEQVLVSERSRWFLDKITSIQIDGATTGGFYGAAGEYLGLVMQNLPAEGAALLRVDAISGANTLLE